MGTTRKVVIIGSGPSGYTAAIYAARANLTPVMFTGIQPGGQLMLTTLVENYPGFVDGIDGPPLMETFQKQAERFGTEMIADDVTEVDLRRRPFTVTGGDVTIEAHTVIIATGASAKLLGLPNESKLMGRGVSTCATCDGFFFKDQNIMVVGGGDSALEEALYLARLGRKVDVVHRRESLRGSKIMQERAFKNPKITFLWNTVVEDVLDPAAVTACRYVKSATSPAANTPGTEVCVVPGTTLMYSFGCRSTWPLKRAVLGWCPMATKRPSTGASVRAPVLTLRSFTVVTLPAAGSSTSSTTVFHTKLILGFLNARSCMIFEPRRDSRRCTTSTLRPSRAR